MAEIIINTLQTEGILKICEDRRKRSIEYRQTYRVLGASVETWLTRIHNMTHKIHEPDQIQAFPGMSKYFGLANMRSMAVTAWVRDLLVNTGDIPITASPTPIPDLDKTANDEIQAQLLRITADKLASAGIDPFQKNQPAGLFNGVTLNPAVAKFLKAESAKLFDTSRSLKAQRAQKSMDRMLIKMTDYAVEGEFHRAQATHIEYGTRYPYKVMCGPDWQEVSKPVWNGNKYTYKMVSTPTWRSVNPNDCFFAPDATSAQTGGWFIERLHRTKADIVALRNNKAYDKESVDKLLAKWMIGSDSTPEQISGILALPMDMMCNALATDDTHTGWRMVGTTSGRELNAAGKTGFDDNTNYQADCEWYDDQMVKVNVVKQPSGMRGYYSASFKRLGDSWAGVSPMMLLYDTQITLNQWQFAMAQNFYAASGPMLEVDAGRMESAADFFWNPYGSITSNAKNKAATGQGDILKVHQMPFQAGSMMGLFMQRLRLADLECGIPTEAYGASLPVGGQQTLGEITLKWGASLRGIKDSVQNDDEDVLSQTFKHLYQQCMEYETDPAIKDGGDARIKASGATGLLQREMAEVTRERLLPVLANAAAQDPESFGQAYKDTLTEQFLAMGINRASLPDDAATARESNALIQGLPGTPTLKPDGRSAIPQELQTL